MYTRETINNICTSRWNIFRNSNLTKPTLQSSVKLTFVEYFFIILKTTLNILAYNVVVAIGNFISQILHEGYTRVSDFSSVKNL